MKLKLPTTNNIKQFLYTANKLKIYVVEEWKKCFLETEI